MNFLFHCDVGRSSMHLWHYGLAVAVPFVAAVPLTKMRASAPASTSEDDARRARLLGSVGMKPRG